MRSKPAAFADKPLYLVCNLESYSEITGRLATQRTAEAGREIEYYEDWPPPAEALLLDFSWYDAPRGKPRFLGIYRSRRADEYGRRRKTGLFEVEGVERSAPDEAPLAITRGAITAQLAQWQEIIADSRSRLENEWDQTGCCIQLGKIADDLHARRREGPVLNVLDEKQRYRTEDGLGVSGNWKGPDKAPTRIRVYQVKGGESVAGGVILRRDKVDGRTVIVFEPDDAECGRAWPSARFRTNGCLQTAD